jgi:hypothetical protein
MEPTVDQMAFSLENTDSVCSGDTCLFTILDNTGRRQLTWRGESNPADDSGSYGSRYTTTVSSSISAQAFRDVSVDYVQSTSRMLQPYLSVQCWHSDSPPNLNGSDQYVYFGPGQEYLNGLIAFPRLSPNSSFGRTGDSAYATIPGSDVPKATTYVSFHKLPERISNVTALMVSLSNNNGMDSCSIEAYWVQAKTNLTTGGVLIDETSSHLTILAHNAPLVQISLDWLVHATTMNNASLYIGSLGAYLDMTVVVPLVMSNLPSAPLGASNQVLKQGSQIIESNIHGVQQRSVMNAYCKREGFYKEYDEITLYTSTNWTDPTTLGRFDIQVLDEGYGYNSETSTVWLSLTVVIIYVCVAVLYLSFSLITGRTANSWDSVAELVALALNSQRPETLKYTSVGIETLSTFRQPVSVRVNEHNSLELVFGDGKEEAASPYREVVVNEKY